MRRIIYAKTKIITSLFGSFSGTDKWFGGVLAPNGKIYCVPNNSTQILVIDPATNTTALFGNFSGNIKWLGGVLAPNGKIYYVPGNSTQILVIDTKAEPNSTDLQIPNDLTILSISNYNKYYNKL